MNNSHIQTSNISGKLSNQSSQIDYERVQQYIQTYIANLNYVKDVDITDDGTIKLIKSK